MTNQDQTTTAVVVGTFQVEVVHMDASVERFGAFERQAQAVIWAMKERITIGLHRCACWRVIDNE